MPVVVADVTLVYTCSVWGEAISLCCGVQIPQGPAALPHATNTLNMQSISTHTHTDTGQRSQTGHHYLGIIHFLYRGEQQTMIHLSGQLFFSLSDSRQ